MVLALRASFFRKLAFSPEHTAEQPFRQCSPPTTANDFKSRRLKRAIGFPTETPGPLSPFVPHRRSPGRVTTVWWAIHPDLIRALEAKDRYGTGITGGKPGLEMPKAGPWEKFLGTYDDSDPSSFSCIVSVAAGRR